ncbi:MAG: hypothetical protein JW884_14290 [Deltaproteobacteria bacterium]|nr:hypothetical protein [Deltaproteobacteria bacterium]
MTEKTIPTECKTDLEKTEYWTRAQELLRLEHNEMGVQFRDGKITKKEWEKYRKESFLPRSKKIHKELNESRASLRNEAAKEDESPWTYDKEALKESTKWSPDISEEALLNG